MVEGAEVIGLDDDDPLEAVSLLQEGYAKDAIALAASTFKATDKQVDAADREKMVARDLAAKQAIQQQAFVGDEYQARIDAMKKLVKPQQGDSLLGDGESKAVQTVLIARQQALLRQQEVNVARAQEKLDSQNDFILSNKSVKSRSSHGLKALVIERKKELENVAKDNQELGESRTRIRRLTRNQVDQLPQDLKERWKQSEKRRQRSEKRHADNVKNAQNANLEKHLLGEIVNRKNAGSSHLAKLFNGDGAPAKPTKAKLKSKTAAQLETESLVKQQKAMLKQQKAAAADNQELGESKKNEMQNLFGTAKKVEKKIVKKAKTAAQLETESLVKQQKAMLKQQKAAAADNQELGESTHGEMKNLFGTSQRAHALTPMEAADRAFQARHQGGDHDSAKLMPAENLDALLGLTR
jgi:hypothetical protein